MRDNTALLLQRIVLLLESIDSKLGPRVELAPDESAVARLLQQIALWVREDFGFSVSEVVLHSRLDAAQALRAAIVDVLGEVNARKLGQLLLRVAGRSIGGYTVRRIGSDSSGAIWAISSAGSKPTNSASLFSVR